MNKTAGSRSSSDERLFFRLALALALVIGAGGCFFIFALNHREKSSGIKPDHPRQLVDFSLTDRTGRTVTRAELDGKILVVDFLFTSCSLTCPEVNRRMAEIQQLTTNQPDVRLVSLTVDPRTDTPAELMKFGERFGADTNRWLLLTGDKAGAVSIDRHEFSGAGHERPVQLHAGKFHTHRAHGGGGRARPRAGLF